MYERETARPLAATKEGLRTSSAIDWPTLTSLALFSHPMRNFLSVDGQIKVIDWLPMGNRNHSLQLDRRNHAAVYYGVCESKCRNVVALLGFGTVVFTFSNRLCLLPRQIIGNS